MRQSDYSRAPGIAPDGIKAGLVPHLGVPEMPVILVIFAVALGIGQAGPDGKSGAPGDKWVHGRQLGFGRAGHLARPAAGRAATASCPG